jgi:carboxymethylenebutenolidase
MRLPDDHGDGAAAPPVSRRRAWLLVAVVAGGLAGVASPAGRSGAAAAPLVPPDDKRLMARDVTLPGASGPLRAYYVRPAVLRAKAPAVLLVHESRGRTEYVEDVARRLALAGYLALAPDFLSPRGGTPAEAEKARETATALETDQVTADAVAALVWLKGREEGSGKVGGVGFAWGGGIVGRLAVVAPALDAAAVFYGKPPQPKDVAQVRTPLLLHYAQLDQKVAEAVPAFEAALREAGVPFESYLYEGAGASFHNDTAGARFDAEAAKLAWERTLAFLRQRLA